MGEAYAFENEGSTFDQYGVGVPIRDIYIFFVVFGSIPYILRRPYIGILVSSWLGYMNPHHMTWGPAYYFPFVQLIAIVTIASTIFSSKKRLPPFNLSLIVLSVFIIWCWITTQYALNPNGAENGWNRFLKIQIMIFFCLVLINDFKKLNKLIWVIACSIGYFGVKGGIFTLLTGGNWMVIGPPDSFISGNTEIGFALVIVFPLLWYLSQSTQNKWISRGMYTAMGLTVLAIVGTFSRGAFLAGGCMLVFMWLKNEHKLLYGIIFVLLAVTALSFMPEKYFEKMETIKTYEEDASAMGRINAWGFAYNLANDRPILGGGFNVFTKELFLTYAPEPYNFHDSHSIYFEVLGEQGYVGLLLFLTLGVTTWRNSSVVIKLTNDRPELKVHQVLAKMLQVSIVAYATGGAFLGLAYFNLPYHLITITVILRDLVENKVENCYSKVQSE